MDNSWSGGSNISKLLIFQHFFPRQKNRKAWLVSQTFYNVKMCGVSLIHKLNIKQTFHCFGIIGITHSTPWGYLKIIQFAVVTNTLLHVVLYHTTPTSLPHRLPTGIPQVSVLDPLLSSIYNQFLSRGHILSRVFIPLLCRGHSIYPLFSSLGHSCFCSDLIRSGRHLIMDVSSLAET